MQLSAEWHTVRDTGNTDAALGEAIKNVMRCGLPIDRKAERDNDLLDFGRARALNQVGNVQVVGTNAVDRRQSAAKYVIKAAKGATALQGPKIVYILDDADRRRITPRIGADAARVARVDITANLTQPNGRRRFGQRARKRLQHRFPSFQHEQRRPPS